MTPLIQLGLIVGIPLLLFVVLRIKPLYLFVSIVTGYVWVQLLGDVADLTLRSIISINNPGSVARILVLSIPLLLTMLFMKKSLATRALPFQFFLLFANSLLYAVIFIGLLPDEFRNNLYQSNAGNIVRQATDVIIAGVAGLHVLMMWILRSKTDSNGKHHKR